VTRASEIVGWQVWRRIGADAQQVRYYARTAATWESLRKRIDAGEALPSDAEKYRELTDMMQALVAALGLTSEKRWHLVPRSPPKTGKVFPVSRIAMDTSSGTRRGLSAPVGETPRNCGTGESRQLPELGALEKDAVSVPPLRPLHICRHYRQTSGTRNRPALRG
jgi:hypothetical protein